MNNQNFLDVTSLVALVGSAITVLGLGLFLGLHHFTVNL